MTKTSFGSTLPRSISVFVMLALSIIPLSAKDAKLKPEELVAKHLASIGTPEAIAEVHSRVINGTAQVIFRLPNPGQTGGEGAVLSDGKSMAINMTFSTSDYPLESLAFDGKNVTVGQVRAGQRSHLSSFVYQFDVLMKEGLLGGAMTTAWALLDLPGRQPKLDSTGLKKFEGKQLHEIKYRAKKGAGDLSVSLYFEPETYRHLHTQIRLVQPAVMGRTPMESSSQRETVQTLVESYDDFKTVGSLTLPHSYKLVQTIEGQNATLLVEYRIAASQISHNQTPDPKLFSVH